MKFSKFAILSSLLLSGSSLAVAQDDPLPDPVEALQAADLQPADLNDIDSGECGFGYDASCEWYNNNYVGVGVWLCPSDNLDDCGCVDYQGCTNANYFGYYSLKVNWDDDPHQPGFPNQDKNVVCDTLGGYWREGDNTNTFVHSLWGDDDNYPVFGGNEKSVHIEVHPTDWWKLGGDPSSVYVFLNAGDYCTGTTPEDHAYPAYDYESWAPGNYGWGYDFAVKSIRPAVDYVTMKRFDFTGPDLSPDMPQPYDGVGLKMNVWPNRQMAYPYDQMLCSTDDGTGLLDIGDYNLGDENNPDCQKAEDQVWCMNDGNSWSAWSNASGWANPEEEVWDEEDGYFIGNHNPMVPMGSVMFGLDDSIPCQYKRSDYCYNWGLDLQNQCLSAKFYYFDYEDGSAYDKNYFPITDDGELDEARLNAGLLGQAFIPMQDMCDNDSVCLNTSDGEFDGDEAGTCADGAFMVDFDWTPYQADSEQMWWTNYIVAIGDCEAPYGGADGQEFGSGDQDQPDQDAEEDQSEE